MKDYSNFTENDVVDIRGLSEEQVKFILDLNPNNDCDVKEVIINDYYRPLADKGKGYFGTIKYAKKKGFTIHPASDFLPQEKPTFKRGDLIKVWDKNEMDAEERIGLTYIKGAKSPVICVYDGFEKEFKNNEPFLTMTWKHWKPISTRKQEILQQIAELQKELETIKD